MSQAFSPAGIAGRQQESNITLDGISPRHDKGFKLGLMVHEVDMGRIIGETAVETMLTVAALELFDALGGKDLKESFPILDGAAAHLAIKSAKAWARSESDAQLVQELLGGLLVGGALHASGLPRWTQVGASIFVMKSLRELSRAATSEFKWTLSPDVVDTSVSRETAATR